MPLQGDRVASIITQGDALGYGLLPFQGVWSLHAKLEEIRNEKLMGKEKEKKMRNEKGMNN